MCSFARRMHREMRLTSVHISEFESYRPGQLVDIDRSITILGGRNNVGKSGFLRALHQVAGPTEDVTENFKISYEWEASATDLAVALGRDVTSRITWDTPQEGPHTLYATFAPSAANVRNLPVVGATPEANQPATLAGYSLIESGIVDSQAKLQSVLWSNQAYLTWADPRSELGRLGPARWWPAITNLVQACYYIQPRRFGAQPRTFSVTETRAWT